ncbi:MAG: hypothetical protein AAGA60_17015 [Cyanobacteria bacterium P01_E01_bin.42]
MTEPNQYPQPDDAVLSNSQSDRGGMVLGGVEGVKQRLSSPVESDRIEALYQALQYGREGVNLVIEAFLKDTFPVRRKAYTILRDRQEADAKQVLQEYYFWTDCEPLFTIPLSASHQYATEISADGRILARSYQRETRANTSNLEYWVDIRDRQDPRNFEYWVEIWDLQTSEKIATLRDFSHPVHLALTSNGKTLITGEGSHSHFNCVPGERTGLKVWDIATGKKIFSDRTGAILSMSLGSDDLTLAASHYISESRSRHARITLWDLAQQQRSHEIDWNQRNFTHTCHVAIHATEKIVIGYHDLCGSTHNAFVLQQQSSSIAKLKAWDISEQPARELYSLIIPHPYQVECLAINPNGLSFASGVKNTYIPSSRKKLTELYENTIKHETITLWKLQELSVDSSDRQNEQCLTLLEGHEGTIHSLAFSPNGLILASASNIPEYNVRLWDVESGQEIYKFPKILGINCIKFHQNGKTLYISTFDKLMAWGWK